MTEYIERECKRHGITKFRREGNVRWRCISCSSLYRKNNRRSNKAILVAEHGGKCIRCGYNKSIRALEFHHRDPTQKDFRVSGRPDSMSLKSMRIEAKKCDLVCSNCHSEIHEEWENEKLYI